jgi:hypothetical protein
LLHLEGLPGETAEQIYAFLVSVVEKNHLKFDNMTAYSADNAPVNFGGAKQNGTNNVFHKLKGN